ncbi:HNH endonuclease signature motif containing protein [Mycolicibacterium goodii]|uniref:HNH endonuclease signature motif containing protein n=1 Tax=Mycolicibacterium goodii TaxID=134601 RepID=UPI00296E7BB9
MFDGTSDAGLIDTIAEAKRQENTATARRLLAIAELDTRRTIELVESIFWRTDPFEEVCAEVSAALRVSRSRAGWQVRLSRVLRDRIPNVAAVFAQGDIDLRVVTKIATRTELVDRAAMAALDEVLARRAPGWMRLSEPKLQERIDQCILRLDPEGQRVTKRSAESRFFEIQPADTPGMALAQGYLPADDAAGFDKRLEAIAATVCPNDPRTLDQRRSDAVGALGRYRDTLDCQCGRQDCTAVAERQAVTNAMVHVLAEQSTLEGGNEPGYLLGFGMVPADMVRTIAETALTTPVTIPADAAQPGYRPNAELAEFIRWRDLTCRFPGCDAPAMVADIDHTRPYPQGPTHPSNTKLYCRTHHLIKTFYTGPNGWTDRQLPDGTIEFTAPTGHTYTTEPQGAALFPILGTPTGELDLPPEQQPHPTAR